MDASVLTPLVERWPEFTLVAIGFLAFYKVDSRIKENQVHIREALECMKDISRQMLQIHKDIVDLKIQAAVVANTADSAHKRLDRAGINGSINH